MSLDTVKLQNLILHLAGHPKVFDLGITKLYKLIYFSDVRHLREYGQSITGSEYIKYPHGPVPSRGEKILKVMKKESVLEEKPIQITQEMQRRSLRALRHANLSVFSEQELSTIDAVCTELGAMTATALSDLSHDEPAWICAPLLDKLSPSLMMYGQHEDAAGL